MRATESICDLCESVFISVRICFSIMKNVKIYTTPTCVYCKMSKEFFKEHNIQYEEKNVATDAVARDEMVQKSGQLGVPVIVIDGNIIVGFDQPKLSELLGV